LLNLFYRQFFFSELNLTFSKYHCIELKILIVSSYADITAEIILRFPTELKMIKLFDLTVMVRNLSTYWLIFLALNFGIQQVEKNRPHEVFYSGLLMICRYMMVLKHKHMFTHPASSLVHHHLETFDDGWNKKKGNSVPFFHNKTKWIKALYSI